MKARTAARAQLDNFVIELLEGCDNPNQQLELLGFVSEGAPEGGMPGGLVDEVEEPVGGVEPMVGDNEEIMSGGLVGSEGDLSAAIDEIGELISVFRDRFDEAGPSGTQNVPGGDEPLAIVPISQVPCPVIELSNSSEHTESGRADTNSSASTSDNSGMPPKRARIARGGDMGARLADRAGGQTVPPAVSVVPASPIPTSGVSRFLAQDVVLPQNIEPNPSPPRDSVPQRTASDLPSSGTPPARKGKRQKTSTREAREVRDWVPKFDIVPVREDDSVEDREVALSVATGVILPTDWKNAMKEHPASLKKEFSHHLLAVSFLPFCSFHFILPRT